MSRVRVLVSEGVIPMHCDCPKRRPDSPPFLRHVSCAFNFCPACGVRMLPMQVIYTIEP